MTEIGTAITALIAAAVSIGQSDSPLFVVMFLLIAALAWRLIKCEAKHETSAKENARLMAACVQMGSVLNTLSGNDIVDVSDLEEILAGKSALKYGARFRPPKPPDPGQGTGA